MRNSAWAAVATAGHRHSQAGASWEIPSYCFWREKDSEVDTIGNKIPLQVSPGIYFRR
jgi:hypothetical protein